MTENTVSIFNQLFNNNKSITVLFDKLLKPVWGNTAFHNDKNFSEYPFSTNSELCNRVSNDACPMFYITFNFTTYICTLIYSDENMQGIQFVDVKTIHRSGSFPSPTLATKALISRIRSGVSAIAVATDEIYNSISHTGEKDRNAVKMLNSIEGNLLYLLRGTLEPEQIISSYLNEGNDIVVDMNESLCELKEDVDELFGEYINVTVSCELGLCTRTSKNAFYVILSQIVDEIIDSNVVVDQLDIRCTLDKENMIHIVFDARNTKGNKKNTLHHKTAIDDETLLYEQKAKIKDSFRNSFCNTYKARLISSQSRYKFDYEFIIPMLNETRLLFCCPNKFQNGNRRFNYISEKLSHIKVKDRYKFEGENKNED